MLPGPPGSLKPVKRFPGGLGYILYRGDEFLSFDISGLLNMILYLS